MSLRITFGVVEHGEFPVQTEQVKLNPTREGEYVWGEFAYESEPLFGSPNTASGEFVYSPEDGLLGLIADSDSLDAVIRAVNDSEECDFTVSAPEYPLEASHDFYEAYGRGGYTTSFREGPRDGYFELGNDSEWISPEDIADERARTSRRVANAEFVEEITDELLEDGYRISSMDMRVTDGGDIIRFTAPLNFFRLPENADDAIVKRVCERAKQLLHNEVPT